MKSSIYNQLDQKTMEVFKFSSLAVSNLLLNDFYSLTQSTIDYSKSVIVEIGGMPAMVMPALIEANEAMAARMNRAQRLALTSKVEAADRARDACFGELKREVTNAQRSRTAAKVEAGNQLKLFLEPYWTVQTNAMNTETELILEMLDAYENDSNLIDAAVALGITNLFADLGALNLNFSNLYKQRNSDQASASGPSASSLRPAVEASFNEYCRALEQLVNFAPTETATTLVNKLDTLRKTYVRLVSSTSASATQDSTQGISE